MEYTLVGVDGNAFAIIGYVKKAMKREGYSQEAIDNYTNKATEGDYNNLVSVSVDQIHEVNRKRRESNFYHEL